MRTASFYQGKRVFVTGHTGFKGSWLSRFLVLEGADVCGFSLEPNTEPSLFVLANLAKDVRSVIGDVRDRVDLTKTMKAFRPDIVLHLAAQPIVRASYDDPVYTYETNVMGTVNLLEAVRSCDSVRSVLNVTTDKVYRNLEWNWGYRENDVLDGYDPYSNSKSCSELVTATYVRSFFRQSGVAVSTARAGNVIGGGDFAPDRIIPDCIRAVSQGKRIVLRNPDSIRPYQHVLEPLAAYLLIAERQTKDSTLSDSYNVGPDDADCVTTGMLADLFCKVWGEGAAWDNVSSGGPHEANFLKLDCSKVKNVMQWSPRWHVFDAVERTVEWARAHATGQDIRGCMDAQIDGYRDAE